MTQIVNIHQAKTHFSRLIARVGEGHEIIIARAGKPVARLVPIGNRPARRSPGGARGLIVIADDFDAPLPDDIREAFGG